METTLLDKLYKIQRDAEEGYVDDYVLCDLMDLLPEIIKEIESLEEQAGFYHKNDKSLFI